MKVALIQCPVWGTYDPPVALAQLSGCLKESGHDVFIFDLNINLYMNRKENYKNMWAWEQSLFWYNPEYVKKFFKENNEAIECYIRGILKTDAGIIGLSVNAASKLFSIELAKRLKEQNRDLTIVFGGQIFFERKFINSILAESAIDIIVPGEGEVVFPELVKLLERHRNISSCKGIFFKKGNSIINTGTREPLSNLDSLPFLDFSDLPLTNYDDSKHIPFMASRGCILNCAFCSSRVFWPGYRAMSGERIFKEIEFHKNYQNKLNSNLGHVDFLDLLFNGNMKSLVTFCDLVSDARLDFAWTANMIIRPEMNADVIRRMKKAGCEHIIFGIESGSQHVLELMRKHYRIDDADRIIRCLHKEGIIVTCNFMFGFPGETEEDFQKTLDFIKRNAEFLDRAYPSRTYCAIEEYSYLHGHPEEFGVRPNPSNHLYWDSFDGRNSYPVRLQRCEDFCNLAASLGIEVGSGVQTSVELDKWYSLGFYYESRKDYRNAINCFINYHKLDPINEVIFNKINTYFQEFEKGNLKLELDNDSIVNFMEAVSIRKEDREKMLLNEALKLGREQSVTMLKKQQIDNSVLNDKDFEAKSLILESSPKTFFLQLSGPCNSNCVFCSRGKDYEFFSLSDFQERFEQKLHHFLSRAENIVLTGSGEFLLLPEAETILDYLDNNFPNAEKMFSTNGSSLTPNICEKIIKAKSKYTIHVSLHASNSQLHRVMTRADNFYKILGQLKYLLDTRGDSGNPAVNLIFVATTLNIEDLPNFVRLAANLKIEKIICYYNYIYVPAQKYLSCFFKQQLTNKMLDEAGKVAKELNIKIDLPPSFGQKEYADRGICREPWGQIMFNSRGHILPCDASEDCSENLETTDQFLDIWNGKYYCDLRKKLREGTNSCFSYCFRANPKAVNDFRSHVIRRGREDSEIDILWADNF